MHSIIKWGFTTSMPYMYDSISLITVSTNFDYNDFTKTFH